MKQSTFLSMLIIGILFFIFGFVTWLNGSLIPFLQVICDLSDFEALFVTFAFYISYTVMALPMSYVLDKVGYKDGMSLGLLIMALGSLLFIPAALSREYVVFLIALFTLGSGLTLLQTASNPYVVLIGPVESAAMRISIMGIINKSAGVLAPLVFTAYILSGVGDINSLRGNELDLIAINLMEPYVLMAVILTLLVAFIKYSPLEDLEFQHDPYDNDSVFVYPRVVLGAVALFFYVGIEVIAGDTIGLYAQSLSVDNATSLTSYTMVFMVIAYIIGVISIPKYISQEKALMGSSLLGMTFIIGVVFSSKVDTTISEYLWGWSGIPTVPDTIAFVALLGLSNALVWPSIWPLALENLGKRTSQGSALLIMAIAGGAVLPLVFGQFSEYLGDMQVAYLFGLVCYFFIFVYATIWHKMSSWR